MSSMDLSSMTSLYTDYIKDTAKKTPITPNGVKDFSKATDEELMEACKQFEAYFVEQMMKEMWKTVKLTESDSASMNTLTDYFKDELISETAKQAVETNSTGLAQTLYEQMKRNYNL